MPFRTVHPQVWIGSRTERDVPGGINFDPVKYVKAAFSRVEYGSEL